MDEVGDANAVRPQRLTVRGFARDLADELLSFERGLPWTFWQLTRRPGTTIRRYVEWRDARVTKPVRYLIVALAVAGTALWLGGFAEAFSRGFAEGYDSGAATDGPKAPWLRAVFTAASRPEALVLLALLPALAGAVEGAYRSSGINVAESFAISTYVLAHAVLLFGLASMAAGLVPAIGVAGVAVVQVTALVVYPIAAIRGYFAPEPRATRRAVLAYVAATALALVAAVAVLVLREALRRS